jgi:7-keto-8-aminopelargonate synthetase-like enzyme
MNRINSFYETIDHIITDGVNREILHLYTDDEKLSGNLLKMNGKEIVNFGSCSYLGLEFDERLKASAIRALEQYGTQFSESRAYVSVSLYKKLEEAFERLFGAAAVVTPTTTLGHMAALPVLVGNEDAVIMDHQVHNSVQMAVSLLKARGVHVELLRHNRIDLLKQRALELRGKYKKVWYMADGIYSMFGNKSPVKHIYELIDSIPELWYYVDDAHGMSIYGQHGRGYVLHEGGYFHPRMILATSLAKAFATGGAVLLFPDKELARRVRTCGGTLITSGPLQPATLGAAIASAAIHLSDEIYKMQEELQDNIRYANLILKKRHLPVISTSDAAVFFIGVSLPKIGYAVIKRMLRHGYYLNLGIFPAVPI